MPDAVTSRSPRQTAALAAQLAPQLAPPLRIYLSGTLGAGKTFFVQSLLAALGERGRVRSPSYSLVHSYRIGTLLVHHVDCYRLQGAVTGDDLLELLEENAICLLEWPEHASALPPPDLQLQLEICGGNVRRIHAHALSARAQTLAAP